MAGRTDRPILGAEHKETPPDQGEVSEVRMSPYHRAHLHCSVTERVAYSQIAAFLVRQARRAPQRRGFGPSTPIEEAP